MLELEEDLFFSQGERYSRRRSHAAKRIGLCPSCNRTNVNIGHSIGSKGIVVAICAYSHINEQLLSEWVGRNFDSKCFAVCSGCYKEGKKAIAVADTYFKGEVTCISKGDAPKSLARCLRSPIFCGEGRTLV